MTYIMRHGERGRTNPPRISIRDLIALMCDMDAADKGALNIRRSFFDKGWEPKVTHRFAGARYETPVVEWSRIDGPEGLLAFCDQNFRSGRFSKVVGGFRGSEKWTKLEALVMEAAADAKVSRPAAAKLSKAGSGGGSVAGGKGSAMASASAILAILNGSSDDLAATSAGAPALSSSSSSTGGGGSTNAVGGGTPRAQDSVGSGEQWEGGSLGSSLSGAASGGSSLGDGPHIHGSGGSPSPRSSSNLIGRAVLKYWPGHGWFSGKVVETVFSKGKQRQYKVMYDDEEAENYSYAELVAILIPDKSAQVDRAMAADDDARDAAADAAALASSTTAADCLAAASVAAAVATGEWPSLACSLFHSHSA